MADVILRRDLATADLSDVVTRRVVGSVTPGEVLLAEFLEPLGLSARALAREIRVPPNRITKIIAGERAITAETAVLLGLRFGTTADFWLRLQVAHDLEAARRKERAELTAQLRALRKRAGSRRETKAAARAAVTAEAERLEGWLHQLEAIAE